MTSLLEGAKKLVSRSTDIGALIEGLDAAIVASRGRLPDALLDDSQTVLEPASSRLWLSADHTVVALAGATGSGKSSTFNALAGLELSAVGVRRPTTSWATACVWWADGAEDLLDWLGIPPRHRVVRSSMLEATREDDAMRGVVLLDLPEGTVKSRINRGRTELARQIRRLQESGLSTPRRAAAGRRE